MSVASTDGPSPARAASEDSEQGAAEVAFGCSRLASSERELVLRVLARGGRATLDEAAVDPALVLRLERMLGWFGFERGSPRAGPLARVAIASEALDLVASSLAGAPSLRRRPIARGTLEARIAALPQASRAFVIAPLVEGGPFTEPGLAFAPPRDLARELCRADRVIARAKAGGERVERLVAELHTRGGVVPLVALPAELRETALARGEGTGTPGSGSGSGSGSGDDALALSFLGETGRLDLRALGIDLDAPTAILHAEVHAALGRALAPKPRVAARGGMTGALLAVEPVIVLARGGELAVRDGVLAPRTRERVASVIAASQRQLGRAEDEPLHLVRALVSERLLERGERGTLLPGSGLEAWRRSSPRERCLALLRGYENGSPPPGGSAGSASALAAFAREELLALEGRSPLDLPARLAVFRALDAMQKGAGDKPPRYGSANSGVADGSLLDLEDAVALAWASVVPAAEALGLVQVETDERGAPVALVPTPLLESLRDPGPGVQAPAIAAADGELLVLPGPGALEAAFLASRLGELEGTGEALRFRIDPGTVRAAHLAASEARELLERLRALVRGGLPASFERLLRDGETASVRAREALIHVLEIPKIGAADRAARILGALVVDRLTPTLLVLRSALTPAARRALAAEGILVDP